MEKISYKTPFLEESNPIFQLFVLLALWMGLTIFAAILTEGITLIIYGLSPRILTAPYLWITQSLASVCMFFLPAIFFSHLKTGTFLGFFKITSLPTRKIAGKTALLSLVILPVVAILAYFNEKMILPESLAGIEQWMREMENQSAHILEIMTSNQNVVILFVNLIVMAIMPAITEEFFFRGTMQPFFESWFKNKHIAIWLTAFIFSAIHFQFFGFIPRFLLGAYLGYLMIWGRSLWLPILAHFLHNGFSILIDFSTKKANYDIENTELTDIPGIIPYSILLFVLLGSGLYSLHKSRS